MVVHCGPFGNLRPVVGIALQETRADGLGAAWVVARAAGAARCSRILTGFVEHGIGVVTGGLSRWLVLADRSRWEASSGGFSCRVCPVTS